MRTVIRFSAPYMTLVWCVHDLSQTHFVNCLFFRPHDNRAVDPAEYSRLLSKSSLMQDQSTTSKTARISTSAWTPLTPMSKFSSWLTRKSTLLQQNNRSRPFHSRTTRMLRPAHQHRSKRRICLIIIIIVRLLCGNLLDHSSSAPDKSKKYYSKIYNLAFCEVKLIVTMEQ